MSLSLMQPSRKIRVLRWLGSLVALALLIILFVQQGWEEIFSAVEKITVLDLIISLCLVFLSRFAVVGRWFVLLRATDVEISLRQVLRLTFAGLFGSNFLPTTIGGDLIRLAGAIQLKIDGGISAASLVVDRLVGMLGMAIILPLGIGSLVSWVSTNPVSAPQKYIESLLFTSQVGIIWKKGVHIFERVVRSLAIWRKKPKALVLGLVFTSLHMLFLFCAIYVLLHGMHNSLPLWKIAGLWSFVYFVTLIPISINGLGLQEISISFVFSNVGGISIESGLVVAVLIRTLVMVASLPGALFVPAIMAASDANKEKSISNG